MTHIVIKKRRIIAYGEKKKEISLKKLIIFFHVLLKYDNNIVN